ncbi:hypothetical protein E1091_15740 [Micromonospora fluostatini]|uniref:Uncharacterized protein n=1 Tax=Micromonospora fluostatini TaxID=1629071 RepID=A0ABY2DE57_9ACTN|nr:hypothetical protein E1091_15740 [Micromonospora fluostatini]
MNTRPVVCLDCGRPVRTAVSRARRVGSGCWRERRRAARAQAAPVALPGLGTLAGHGDQAGHDGENLLTGLAAPAAVDDPAARP